MTKKPTGNSTDGIQRQCDTSQTHSWHPAQWKAKTNEGEKTKDLTMKQKAAIKPNLREVKVIKMAC